VEKLRTFLKKRTIPKSFYKQDGELKRLSSDALNKYLEKSPEFHEIFKIWQSVRNNQQSEVHVAVLELLGSIYQCLKALGVNKERALAISPISRYGLPLLPYPVPSLPYSPLLLSSHLLPRLPSLTLPSKILKEQRALTNNLSSVNYRLSRSTLRLFSFMIKFNSSNAREILSNFNLSSKVNSEFMFEAFDISYFVLPYATNLPTEFTNFFADLPFSQF
jgi:hypothetical protein